MSKKPLSRKRIEFTGCRGNHFYTINVSRNLALMLSPDLKRLCQQRDSAWSILLGITLELGYCPTFWWRIATEAEAVIEHIGGDYSI